MNWTALSKPLLRLGLQVALAVAAYWLLGRFSEFTRQDAEGLSTLIQLIGSLYAVVFAFVIFVIWGQFNDVENIVMRECNSLNDLLRFSRYVNADASRSIRRAVVEYAQSVLSSEWQMLAKRERDPQTERSFIEVMNAVVRVAPTDPAEVTVYQRLVDIARKAGEHRDERISRSLTRIPGTLLRFVNALAGALLLLVFVYPFHNGWVGVCCLVFVQVVLFLANLVMTDTDNPFEGVCNISSQPFSDLVAAH